MCTALVINFTLGLKRAHWGPNLVQDICWQPLGWFSRFRSHIKSLHRRCMLTCQFFLWSPGGPKRAQSCPEYMFETTGLIFRMWKPFVPRCTPASPFAIRDLNMSHGSQILSGVWYMLANTGLIFALIIYRTTCKPWSFRCVLVQYVFQILLIYLIMEFKWQWSLLGHQIWYKCIT